MPNKLTEEVVLSILSDRGIDLLDPPYKNTQYRHSFKCNCCSHIWSTLFNTIRRGSGCPVCNGKVRFTDAQVKSFLEGTGITIMDLPYQNIRHKHTFRCEYGHTWKASLDKIKNAKTKCPECTSAATTLSKVYILTSSKGIKIGVSGNVHRRLLEVKRSSNIEDLSIFYESPELGYNLARDIEKHLHQKFTKYNLGYKGFDGSTEFFSIDKDEAKSSLIERLLIS